MSEESTAIFNDANGQEAFAALGSTDMQLALLLMAEIANEARKIGLPEVAVPLQAMLRALEADLSTLARATTSIADSAAVERLRETQRRPETTRSLHLEDLVHSIAFPRGTIKIGLIEELDKATNPDGYGPYWRAQEYGSVAVGNPMTGRVLFGRFEGPSHDDVPRSEFAGAPNPPGAEFRYVVPDEEGGLGTISHEDQPRHFLEAGLTTALGSYSSAVADLSKTYAARILELGA